MNKFFYHEESINQNKVSDNKKKTDKDAKNEGEKANWIYSKNFYLEY